MASMRRGVVAIALLAAGAALNVGIAWALMMRQSAPGTFVRADGGWYSESVAMWQTAAPSEFGRTPIRTGCAELFGCEILAAWGKRDPSDPATLRIEQRRYGWPMRSLECTIWGDPPAQGDRHEKTNGLQFGVHPDRFVRVLPVSLIYAGFAINTLLFAMSLAFLVFAPFAARQMRRRRLGLCPSCGYRMRGSSACSECGATLVRNC